MARTKPVPSQHVNKNKKLEKPSADAASVVAVPAQKLDGGKKKKRRDRYRIIRNIAKLQKCTEARKILPLETTNKWIRTIAATTLNKPEMRFSPEAILALRHVLIDYGTEVLRDANDIAVLARNSHTVKLQDMKIVDHFNKRGSMRGRIVG